MHELLVDIPSREYTIYIKPGLIDGIGEEIQKIYNNKKVVVITDRNVDRLYGKKIEEELKKCGYILKKVVVEPGEESKSFKTLEMVCDEILGFGINREDLIITFGGGVVGDLGGFAASILLRGVPFIQIPTTLLAQIDSSIGGKVAIDTSRGKNLIGSFNQPKAVFIDPELLKTLDKRFLYDGCAEVIKYGAIKDKEFFYNLLGYDREEFLYNIEKTIYTCCSIKKDIVEKDEKDLGERMLLNFGHTIGHGIERYFDYKKYTHGEAVAIGMYTITKNSEALGITQRGTSDIIKDILNEYHLQYNFPPIDDNGMDKIMEAVLLDKKNLGKSMNIVLLNSIGDGFIKNIDISEIMPYIKP